MAQFGASFGAGPFEATPPESLFARQLTAPIGRQGDEDEEEWEYEYCATETEVHIRY